MASTASLRDPAATPSALRLLRDLAVLVGRWYRDRRDRRELESLDDAILTDIGLSQADVEREALKPFWQAVDRQALDAARRRRFRA